MDTLWGVNAHISRARRIGLGIFTFKFAGVDPSSGAGISLKAFGDPFYIDLAGATGIGFDAAYGDLGVDGARAAYV